MAFANIAMKARYDKMHKMLRLREGSLVYLRLHYGYKVPGVYHKYSNQRVGPFKVLEKVGRLAYRLQLPPNMKIHPVVSVAQIEPAVDPTEDPYHRLPPQPGPVEEEDENPVNPLYEIERFLDKKPGKDTYLVKWKGYGHEYNAWYPLHALGDAQEFVDEYRSRRPTRRRAAALQAPLPSVPPPAAIAAAPPAPSGPEGGATPPTAPRGRGRPRKHPRPS